jgi:ribonuclease E
MSNFLMNLARRSTGLAVVQARVAPVIASGTDTMTAPATRNVPPAAASQAPTTSEPARALPAVHVHVERESTQRVAPVGRQFPAEEPRQAAPEAPRAFDERIPRQVVQVSTAAVTVPIRTSRWHPPSESAREPSGVVPARAAEPVHASRVESPRVEREESSDAPREFVPVHQEPIVAPPQSPPRQVPTKTVRERAHVIERVLERAAAAEVIVPSSSIQPPPPHVVQARVQEPTTAESRVVHVRIGSIEIHGAPPAAAPPPAAAAPPTTRSTYVGGFDGFARLRSYAPWEW